MTLGEHLKHARTRADLKQREVGKRTGINYKTLSNWENDVSNPSPADLKVLADVYHVTTDELLGRDAPKPAAIMEEMTRLLLQPPDGGANPTKEMLDNYSSLSAEGKEKARSFIKYLVSEDKESRIKKDFGKSPTA